MLKFTASNSKTEWVNFNIKFWSTKDTITRARLESSTCEHAGAVQSSVGKARGF